MERKLALPVELAAPYDGKVPQADVDEALFLTSVGQDNDELGADEAYFREEPIAPPAPPAEPVPVQVHPAVEEIKQQMAGLTAEEIMAGMLPELSRLYRINGELNEAIAELRETQAMLTSVITDRDNTIATTYEELRLAYTVGQQVEEVLGQAKADIILANAELTVASTQRDSHLNDLQVISSMLREILARAANIKDSGSHNEYYNSLCRKTAIELVRDLVGQATDPRDSTQSFLKRVSACRTEAPMATDGGNHESHSGTA